LNANSNGLSQAEAFNRLKKFGYNQLPKKAPLGKTIIFFSQFKNSLVVILIIASIISFLLTDKLDAYIILAAVFLNVVIGFFQENKAQTALEKLKKYITTQCRVIRDKKEYLIETEKLVPGDIIIITAGDRLSADVRLLEVNNLEIEEANLTGESLPVVKSTKSLEVGVVLAERENMAYQGTVVIKGKAKGLVVATGQETEMGKIATQLNEVSEEKTPLQKRLIKLGHQITYLFFFLCLFIFIVGVLAGHPVLMMFYTSVAVAVSAIPEGLLVSITVILAIGMQTILKKKALVTKLISAETLGSTTVICTDKTGTITTGEMQVTHIEAFNQKYSLDGKRLKEKLMIGREILLSLKIGMLCNEAVILNEEDELTDWEIVGSATDRALLLAGVQAGLNKNQLEKETPMLDEIPFDSEMKIMISLRELDEKENIVYVKGAPEKILEHLSFVENGSQRQKIDQSMKQKITEISYDLSNKGLRLIALAYQPLSKEIKKIEDIFPKGEIKDLTWVGLMGIKDPLRAEAKETIKLARQAGLKVVILTGDNRVTAKSIAQELGLIIEKNNIIDGQELLKLNDEELKHRVREIKVYSRVTPADKLRIIKAWKEVGEVVAMTGDGINDAPALKQADIGIALGSGTEVAKETADLILLDNNFSTIIAAIKQGRVIYDNIKKVILYLLSDSFSEIFVIFGSFILALPLPFLAAQILWINLISDGLPNFALTMEPEEKGVMEEKPLAKDKPVFGSQQRVLIFIISLITGLGILSLFYIFLKATADLDLARTIAFTALGVDSLLYVFSCRSFRHSLFNKQFFTNIYLIGAVIIGFFLQLLAVYWHPLQIILRTKPLTLEHWFYIIIFSLLVIFVIELTKMISFIQKNKLAKINKLTN